MKEQDIEATVSFQHVPTSDTTREVKSGQMGNRTIVTLRIVCSVLLLFLNYFLAQYDKFVLSYFQAEVIQSLNLTSVQYGVLSGYATGILYALLAIPIAFVADYTRSRVWVLSVAACWWSLCVLCQGLSHNFWQILLARIGMGIGQAPVEALSISLISDLVPLKWLFFCERCVDDHGHSLGPLTDPPIASSTWAFMLVKLSQVRSQLHSSRQARLGTTLSKLSA